MMPSYLYLFTFIGAVLLNTHISYGQQYQGCHHDSPLTIWLSRTGYCLSSNDCNILKNCTTLYGNLIIRSTLHESKRNSLEVSPYFPKLREITGFLVIIFYNQPKFNLLPSLAVIRGNTLIYNYAFVVYLTDLKEIYFPELTTILHGGVRIERNNKLCYVETIRWKSIVKDKDQEEKFGIVLEANHMNCDTSCATKKCSALSGHGEDPTVQYCWGLGNSQDFQCQKFCDLTCGLEGCVQNTTNSCCSEECLGGCSAPSSAYSCNACKNYRVETSGKCVTNCPLGTFLVNNLICKSVCPGSVETGDKQYLLENRCVNECPAGYYKNDDYVCKQCSDSQNCERVCKLSGVRFDDDIYLGAIIRVPTDIVDQKLTGCTEIIGSLTFELQKGTGNIENFLKGLKWLRIVRGHIKIHQTPLINLDFFENLEVIDPPKSELLHDTYAVFIYDNKNLEHMWTPAKNISVTGGGLFAQSNPRLCPDQITKLQENMYNRKNQKISLSQQNNGNQVVCQVERLQMSVTEVQLNNEDPLDAFNFNMDIDFECFMVKCAKVKWKFVRESSSYFILFYTIYYLEIDDHQTIDTQAAGGSQDNKPWETVEVDKPSNKNFDTEIQMSKVIKKLSPNARYAFYVKEILTNGEGKSSKIQYLKVSQGIPTAPLGVEASFLSESSIRLQWRTPDKPNGEIIAYQLYWRKASYSFWEDQTINWCKRVVKIGITQPRQQEQLPKDGSCPNVTCNCEKEKEISKAMEIDREAFRLKVEFQERMTRLVFTKEKGTDNDQTNVTSIDDTTDTNQTESPAVTSATPNPKHFVEPNVNVSGNVFTFDVEGLEYFQDYIFSICACTEDSKGGGCAVPNTAISSPCASAQARTGINHLADNLEGNVAATVDGSWYNISWNAPLKPNAVVLKYEVLLSTKGSYDDIIICRSGHMPTYLSQSTRPGDYTVKLRAISPAGNGSWSEPVHFTIEDRSAVKNNMVVMAVSVSAVVLILILMSFLIYYTFFKRNTEKNKPGVLYASVNPEYMNASEVYMPDEWELDREKIELLRELGQGSFGMVYEGIAHGIVDSGELRVAVKTVNENASIRDRIEFLQEASIMKAFNSNHVVKLIGVVSQGQPTFVVMELMGRGDLKSFLRSRRPEEKSNLLPPNRQERLQMAAEIADGMAYLAARKFVHRDLAARNCMVAIDFTVKIGDFGMTRDIYETDYYRKGGKGLLPVRWMAPESLRDGLFTAASDVWSYGVVLWEIATLAYQPYQGKSNEEVLHFVLNGGQLVYPENTDTQLKEFMDMCWQRDPKLRPSFLEIIRLLEDDVSEDFVMCSFYHEMKRKALEDTMYRESTLLELLDRPDSCSKANSIKDHSLSPATSVDSGAFIENPKPSIDYTPDLNLRKSLLLETDESGLEKTADSSATMRNCRSLYDNYGTTEENMKYGDTPVKSGNGENASKELKLSKIFLRKPVPV